MSTAPRRILDQLGEDETILSTDYTAADLRLFVPALVLAVLIIGTTPGAWRILGFALGALVMLTAAAIIWLSPDERVAYRWLTDVLSFRFRTENTVIPHDSDDDTDSARSLTNVARFLGWWNSVKRTDGALASAVQIQSANMALADHDRWEAAADGLASLVRGLSFDIQIYSTARPADATKLVAPYRERLQDADVRDNHRLQELIRSYRRRLPAEFQNRRASVREYYVVVAVREMEVKLDQGMLGRFGDAPVIGQLCRMIGAERSGLSKAELELRQQRELVNRLKQVRRGITELPECQPKAVTGDRLCDLLEEFWTGKPSNYDDEAGESLRLHQMPIIRPVPTDEATAADTARETDAGTETRLTKERLDELRAEYDAPGEAPEVTA